MNVLVWMNDNEIWNKEARKKYQTFHEPFRKYEIRFCIHVGIGAFYSELERIEPH